ncbi:MAG: LysM peptidoglycan-binding domain-containing protein [Kiritimatiellales bacterium]
MKKIFFVLLGAGLLTGCETIQLQTRADRAAMTQDQLMAQENQRRLTGRIESLEMEISQLTRDLDTLRSQFDSRCAAIEQKSEADKREMVAKLSSELERLIKQATPAAPAGGSSSAYGYEHIVRPGETLSTIAKAYNVSTKAIISANKISNPNVLSVGQKLFIPE